MEHFDNEFTTIFYLTLAKTWPVYLAKTRVILLVCWWLYLEEMERKVQMEQWDKTVLGHSVCSSMAHLPSEIALISIGQSQDQCAKHVAHWIFPRIMHWGKWARRSRIRWRRQKPFFLSQRVVSHRDIHGVCPLQSSPRRKVPKSNPVSNINQPHATGRGLAVEIGRPASPTWWFSRYHSVQLDLWWRPSSCYCLGDLCPLCGVIHCACRVQGKKCSTDACGCDWEYRSCISYSNCSDEEAGLLQSIHQHRRGLCWRRGGCHNGECWWEGFGGERMMM